MANDTNTATSANVSNNHHCSATTEKLANTVISPQNNLVTVHLSEDNYLLWKLQIETAVQGYGLECHILGTIPISSKCITVEENKIVNNEDYIKYQSKIDLSVLGYYHQ